MSTVAKLNQLLAQRAEKSVTPLDRFTKEAQEALENGHFESAGSLADRALGYDAKRVRPHYIKSVAFLRLKQNEKALEAAEWGLALAHKVRDSTLVASLQLRRAIALFSLGRIADAKFAIALANDADPEELEKSIPIWKAKIEAVESTEKPTILEVPDVDLGNLEGTKAPTTTAAAAAPAQSTATSATGASATKTNNATSASAANFDPENVRRDWYESSSTVNVSLFLKNVAADTVKVDYTEEKATIAFPQPSGEGEFILTLGKFPYPIDPSKSTFKVFGTKIELTLIKAAPKKWNVLEAKATHKLPDKEVSLDQMREALNEPKLPVINGTKNWEALASAELADDEAKADEDPNDFFKKLFANADDDTKRAMMKSYTESNGTALSTDWGSVSQGKVETSAPSGMEAREWEK